MKREVPTTLSAAWADAKRFPILGFFRVSSQTTLSLPQTRNQRTRKIQTWPAVIFDFKEKNIHYKGKIESVDLEDNSWISAKRLG